MKKLNLLLLLSLSIVIGNVKAAHADPTVVIGVPIKGHRQEYTLSQEEVERLYKEARLPGEYDPLNDEDYRRIKAYNERIIQDYLDEEVLRELQEEREEEARQRRSKREAEKARRRARGAKRVGKRVGKRTAHSVIKKEETYKKDGWVYSGTKPVEKPKYGKGGRRQQRGREGAQVAVRPSLSPIEEEGAAAQEPSELLKIMYGKQEAAQAASAALPQELELPVVDGYDPLSDTTPLKLDALLSQQQQTPEEEERIQAILNELGIDQQAE